MLKINSLIAGAALVLASATAQAATYDLTLSAANKTTYDGVISVSNGKTINFGKGSFQTRIIGSVSNKELPNGGSVTIWLKNGSGGALRSFCAFTVSPATANTPPAVISRDSSQDVSCSATWGANRDSKGVIHISAIAEIKMAPGR